MTQTAATEQRSRASETGLDVGACPRWCVHDHGRDPETLAHLGAYAHVPTFSGRDVNVQLEQSTAGRSLGVPLVHVALGDTCSVEMTLAQAQVLAETLRSLSATAG